MRLPILVNNRNLHPIWHRFHDIAAYWSNFRCRHGQGRSQEFTKGDKPGDLGDRSPPAGSRGRAPAGV